MDHIGFFCSSRNKSISRYYHIISPILSLLYKHGTRTIYYGGGDKGLMGKIYTEGKQQGMNVIGHNLEKWTRPHMSEVIYPNLLDRQNGLIRSCQHYIILPGGIGTLYELTQVLCHNDIEQLRKRIILVNIDHYYDHFVALLQQSIREELTDMDRLELTIVHSIDEFSRMLQDISLKASL